MNGSPYSCSDNHKRSNIPASCSYCIYEQVIFVLTGRTREHSNLSRPSVPECLHGHHHRTRDSNNDTRSLISRSESTLVAHEMMHEARRACLLLPLSCSRASRWPFGDLLYNIKSAGDGCHRRQQVIEGG